jgi:hypothetical protein
LKIISDRQNYRGSSESKCHLKCHLNNGHTFRSSNTYLLIIFRPTYFEKLFEAGPNLTIPLQPSVFFTDRNFYYTKVIFLGREVLEVFEMRV